MQNHFDSAQCKQKSSNLFIWISFVIMVAIIIGGVGWYFYLQGQKITLENSGKNYQNSNNTTTDETQDWKTYSNTAYGYSVKYPSSWYLYEPDINNPTTIGFWLQKYEGEATGVWIYVYENSDNFPVESWWEAKNKTSPSYQELVNHTSRKSAVTNGYDSFIVQSTKDFSSRPFTSTYISNNSQIYNIETNVTNDINPDVYNRYIQIISTFKFTTSSTTNITTGSTDDETADWQTYTNSTYRYSIKYPKTMTAKEWVEVIKSSEEAKKSNANLFSEVGLGENSSLGDYDFSVSVSSNSLEKETDLLGYAVSNLKKEIYSLSGEDGIKATGTGSSSSQVIKILIPHNDLVYIIYWGSRSSLSLENFNQALKTFKFIN